MPEQQAGPRRSPSVPSAFDPIAASESVPVQRRPPGEPPRLRLNASASRRHSPDRQPATAVSPPGPVLTGPEPPPVVPQRPVPLRVPRPRRWPVALVVVAGVLLLVATALALRPDAASRDASVAPEASGAPTDDLAPPVAMAADSEYVRTEVLDGDDLLVTHWISTSTPMDRFRLRPPSSPGLADVVAEADDLVVAADGVTLDGVTSAGSSALPSARELYVRYRLTDALQRSGSVDGRALATVTSLGVGLEGRSLPRTQVFPGGRVLTLACLAQGARAVPVSCGTYVEGAWQVGSRAGEVPVTVVAQLDLAIER